MTSVTGRIEGLAVAHVDDFMVAVHEESPVGQRHFSDVTVLCTRRTVDGSLGFVVSKKQTTEDPVTAKELASLRGLLGQLMWLATEVVPTTPSSYIVALGIFGSGHPFLNTSSCASTWFVKEHDITKATTFRICPQPARCSTTRAKHQLTSRLS